MVTDIMTTTQTVSVPTPLTVDSDNISDLLSQVICFDTATTATEGFCVLWSWAKDYVYTEICNGCDFPTTVTMMDDMVYGTSEFYHTDIEISEVKFLNSSVINGANSLKNYRLVADETKWSADKKVGTAVMRVDRSGTKTKQELDSAKTVSLESLGFSVSTPTAKPKY